MIGMISRMGGSPNTPAIGWAVHFVIGVVGYGILFALLDPRLPGSTHAVRRIVLGTIGWFLMMVMPMAGAGFFALNLGIMAPVMTLVLHIVFGVVLGWTYGRLRHRGTHVRA